MIDINLIRTNKELVKENIKKKFQDQKLPLVDEVEQLDKELRELKAEGDALRAKKNENSALIGKLMREGKKDEADKVKAEVVKSNERIAVIEEESPVLEEKIEKDMMVIPNIIGH